MPRVIILGTGTNVGKSYVTKALARTLGALRPDDVVGALKPIETGFAPATSDAAALSGTFRNSRPPQSHPLHCFAEPLTPYLAAQRAQADDIDLGRVAAWVSAWESEAQRVSRSALRPVNVTRGARAAHESIWTLVESAGGAFSPIAAVDGRAVTNVDLWEALTPCIAVLVARDGLGTLHDIAATLEALASRGRRPDHLVLSAAGTSDLSRGTNAAVLRSLGIADPVAVLREGESDLSPLATALIAEQARSA